MSSDWRSIILGDYIKIKHGFAFQGKYFSGIETKYLLVTPGNFNIGGGFKDDKFKYYEGPILEEYILKHEDLIVTMTDLSKQADTLGFSALVPEIEGKILLHNQRIGLVEFHSEGIDKFFLNYIMRTSNYRHYVLSSATGSTVKHTAPSRIESYELKIPSLQKQQKIAKILGDFDRKIEKNNQINETLEAMAQAIFKSWFIDFDPVRAKMKAKAQGLDVDGVNRAAIRIISSKTDSELEAMKQASPKKYKNLENIASHFPEELVESELGLIPKGWEVSSFGEVSNCLDSQRIPLSKREREKKQPGNIPYYGATSVMDYVNEAIFDGTYLLIGEDGSVIKEDGSPFIQYIWGKSWVNNHAHVLEGKRSITTEHLLLFMKQANISAYITGAVQLKLNQRNMRSIPFVLASNNINNFFNNWIKKIFEQYKNKVEENQYLKGLRDSLLPKLLSGEIEV